ncbi:MAG: PQQ-dependent sugar dehydrogenase, partial [Rhodobacteraceae bacterium]|nr:PQQ-dependent sugar dehydrogenase [Paracoccaceae bacterium]
LPSSDGPLRVTKMIGGLDSPWAIGFLPGGPFLVSERAGALLYVSNGAASRVRNVPKVVAKGQGGLLDVMIPRDFATSRDVFLSYASKQKGGSATAVAVGQLSRDGRSLRNLRTIFVASPISTSTRHFGSRLVEAGDGTLFVTLGERGERSAAQDQTGHTGSIIRIRRDGSVPKDNPFLDQTGIRPEIWSYGHRNPQGAALDARGDLWVSEHGAKGGDEINRIKKGANYGWPVISYGRHYSGAKIGVGTARSGMQQPDYYWDPSIAPSGMMIYSGKLWPQWRGNAFVGSLKFDYISRLNGDPMQEVERIEGKETLRVRDVAEAPDGSIWFISEALGAIYQLSPMQ